MNRKGGGGGVAKNSARGADTTLQEILYFPSVEVEGTERLKCVWCSIMIIIWVCTFSFLGCKTAAETEVSKQINKRVIRGVKKKPVFNGLVPAAASSSSSILLFYSSCDWTKSSDYPKSVFIQTQTSSRTECWSIGLIWGQRTLSHLNSKFRPPKEVSSTWPSGKVQFQCLSCPSILYIYDLIYKTLLKVISAELNTDPLYHLQSPHASLALRTLKHPRWTETLGGLRHVLDASVSGRRILEPDSSPVTHTSGSVPWKFPLQRLVLW